MFRLGALYQLRGHVGRRRDAAPMRCSRRPPTARSRRRRKAGWRCCRSLDTLGAGFQLTTHDLGHPRRRQYTSAKTAVRQYPGRSATNFTSGADDAIELLKAGVDGARRKGCGQRTVALGAPVTIPEEFWSPIYALRLQLYRRLSTLETDQDIESFRRREWSTVSTTRRPRSSNCTRSSRSRPCAGAPISRKCRTRARKASSSPSATILFSNPRGLVRYVFGAAYVRQSAAGT